MTFNPNEHMLKLKSKDGAKDYLPVQWRLVWFREQCPGGTVDTEELAVDLDREVSMEVSAWNNETRRSEKVVKKALGYARFRAVVTDGKGGRATGTKSESAVNFADYIEKAETGAIGRALAALGYGTQFTGDELSEGVERLVDSPVQASNGKSTDQALHDLGKAGSYEQRHEPPITDQQKASIRKLYEHLGEAFVEEQVAAMTYQQAKDALVDLSARYNQMKGRTPAPVVEAAQANGHHDLPTLRELQARCNRVIGSGMWQTMLHKALKIEDDELVLRDDDLTPDDREKAAAYMDYVEQQKKAKAGK